MKGARRCLIVALVLFAGWLGYLGYLALGHSKPVIVSRTQLLTAGYIIKADVSVDAAGKPEPLVQVRQSFGRNQIGAETIKVDNLAEVRLPGPPGGKPLAVPGTYALLLEPVSPVGPEPSEVHYRVVSAPGGTGNESTARRPLVYPWSPEVERQLLVNLGGR